MFRVDWQTLDEILHLIEPTMVARDAAKAINSLVAKGIFTILEEYLMDVSLLKMDLPFAPDRCQRRWNGQGMTMPVKMMSFFMGELLEIADMILQQN